MERKILVLQNSKETGEAILIKQNILFVLLLILMHQAHGHLQYVPCWLALTKDQYIPGKVISQSVFPSRSQVSRNHKSSTNIRMLPVDSNKNKERNIIYPHPSFSFTICLLATKH